MEFQERTLDTAQLNAPQALNARAIFWTVGRLVTKKGNTGEEV
jgi:hypothetical protein